MSEYSFGSHRLDTVNGQLIRLQPRLFALTHYAPTRTADLIQRSALDRMRFLAFSASECALREKRLPPSFQARGTRGWKGGGRQREKEKEKKRGRRPRDIPGPGKRSCIPRFPVPECSRPAMSSTTMPLPLSPLRSMPFHLLHLRGPCISRRQRGHFYPPRSLPPPPVLVPQTTLSPRYSELSPSPHVADYFGRVERIHYASVQFADF